MDDWPDIQKKLDEKMSRLLAQATAVCETAPRPMRLPRSIAPSQWIEFLESHLTLFLATLEAQGINVSHHGQPRRMRRATMSQSAPASSRR